MSKRKGGGEKENAKEREREKERERDQWYKLSVLKQLSLGKAWAIRLQEVDDSIQQLRILLSLDLVHRFHYNRMEKQMVSNRHELAEHGAKCCTS